MRRGVSLLETVVALGIFAFVAIATANLLVAAKNAQFKAASIQSAIDNVRFGLESITKETRTGTDYQLVSCNSVSGSQINFTDQSDDLTGYAFYSSSPGTGGIYRISDLATPAEVCDPSNPAKFSAVTGPEVVIENFAIKLTGAGPNDGQPRLTLSFKAFASDPKLRSNTTMNLQTTVTQRVRDLNQ